MADFTSNIPISQDDDLTEDDGILPDPDEALGADGEALDPTGDELLDGDGILGGDEDEEDAHTFGVEELGLED